jgi:hypothetical protein
VTVLSWSPTAVRAIVRSPEPTSLSLHSLYFPGWRANLDGQPPALGPAGPMGLVTVPLPQGEHDVRLWFGSTRVRSLGLVVTELTILALCAFTAVRGVRAWRRRSTALVAFTAIALVSLGIVAAGAAAALLEEPPRLSARDARWAPVWVSQGDRLQLAAVSLPATARPGDEVRVETLWDVVAPLDENLKVFVHVSDERGQRVAQADGYPTYGAGRTAAWWPGELVRDKRTVTLPSDLPLGVVSVVVGLYEPTSGRRLSAKPLPGSPVTETPDGNSTLAGKITVRE